MDQRDRVRVIATCELFADLPEEYLYKIAERATVLTYPKGQVLFTQGDDSERMFLVLSGTVKISILSEAGKEVIIHLAQPGEALGEISIIDDQPRTATATMRTDGELLALPRGVIDELLKDPEATRALLRSLCTIVRRATERTELLSLHSLSSRLARVLLQNAVLAEDGPRLKMTQSDLALMCGASRPRVNQALMAFVDEGLVETGHQSIRVLDADGLTLHAYSDGS
ncbi:MAG: Crp/Fnr family transcriptional regulator [Pseudomonadota bacterium]